jgi:preprotein translocase subunit SecA
VQIVDESTGRLMPDRSWEQGLHQMIEAKEGVAQTAGRDTLARLTFQRFFPRYYLLSGLTGTAREASRELWSVYRLAVRPVPPNRPDRRQVLPARCLPDEAAKWQAVCVDAQRAARAGQAVLIGTRSVEASERVAAALQAAGVAHVVLNARQDAQEAEIVSQAGRSGQITVATNMAGRGTDIRLDEAARASGGLHVILTEFHDSPRVDRQLFGRGGRQGDPGSVRAIVSTQDVLWQTGSRLWHALAVQAGPVGAVALAWHAHWAQSQAERRGRLQRQQTMQQDRQLKKLIGFAGPV